MSKHHPSKYKIAHSGVVTDFNSCIKFNAEQKELIRLIRTRPEDLPVVFCFGVAGTGKTLVSLAASYQLVLEGEYDKIFYIRENVEVGDHSLGYLPGTLDEKFAAYKYPLLDNVDFLSHVSGLSSGDILEHVEAMPVAYIRGRSISNAIMICDEMQNCSWNAIQTLLTRVGRYCKIIMLGSINQIDNSKQSKSTNAFTEIYDVLKDLPEVGGVELLKSERSDISGKIDEILSSYTKKSK